MPYLEALLLLRSEPSAIWTGERLAKRLYIANKQAEELLFQLNEAGIAAMTAAQSNPDAGERPDGFHYSPASAALTNLIDELAVLYSTELLEITHLIHSKLDRKAQQFADAFKLRKDT